MDRSSRFNSRSEESRAPYTARPEVDLSTRKVAPKLLTLDEAADAARAPVRSVRAWIADGRLKANRAARRVLVRRADLAVFLGVDVSDLEVSCVREGGER
jgi:excisionase family DNA binding protein